MYNGNIIKEVVRLQNLGFNLVSTDNTDGNTILVFYVENTSPLLSQTLNKLIDKDIFPNYETENDVAK